MLVASGRIEKGTFGSSFSGTVYPNIFHSFMLDAVVEVMTKDRRRHSGDGEALRWKGRRAKAKKSRRAVA